MPAIHKADRRQREQRRRKNLRFRSDTPRLDRRGNERLGWAFARAMKESNT